MSKPLMILVTLIYAYVAAEQYVIGNKPMAVVYAGYAFANLGFIAALA